MKKTFAIVIRPKLVRPTLWHQELVMAEKRQAIRAHECRPCICGQPSTIFDVDLCVWRCTGCADAELQQIKASVAAAPPMKGYMNGRPSF